MSLFPYAGDTNVTASPGFTQKSWNVGLSLVWPPCARDVSSPHYCRPIFRVADNGSFITHLSRRESILHRDQIRSRSPI